MKENRNEKKDINDISLINYIYIIMSFKNIIDEIKKEFNYQMNNFKIDEIVSLSKIITEISGNIFFGGVGKSGNMSKHCCDLLKSISLSCFNLNLLNLLHGDIGTIKKNDIVLFFSNSGNTIEILDIIKILKKEKIYVVGICSNLNSQFVKLCDKTIILPFQKEISGKIDKIPTNSCMSQLLFSNILVTILKNNILLNNYKKNHLSGNIGKNLLKVKDVLIKEFPKIIIEDNKRIKINDILLEMTKYKIGCCFFLNNDSHLIGIITDGDIRKLFLINKLKEITLENINTKYYSVDNIDTYIKDINYTFVPILSGKKIIGVICNCPKN